MEYFIIKVAHQLAHFGLIFLFVCCFYLFFFYGEVSWFLAKFVLRCIRAYFSVRLSPVIAVMSLTIVLNLLPNSLVLGRFTVQKHTLPGFLTPGLACVSP